MEQEIKIAVIGGNGKSGTYLVKELLSQGFHLNLLIRHPENFLIIKFPGRSDKRRCERL